MFPFFSKNNKPHARPRTPTRNMLFLLVIAAVAFAFWQNSKQIKIIAGRMAIYDPTSTLTEPSRQHLREIIADFKERHQIELFVELSASNPPPSLDRVKTMAILLHINPETGAAHVFISPLLKKALPQQDIETALKTLKSNADKKDYALAFEKSITILDDIILRTEGAGMSSLPQQRSFVVSAHSLT